MQKLLPLAGNSSFMTETWLVLATWPCCSKIELESRSQSGEISFLYADTLLCFENVGLISVLLSIVNRFHLTERRVKNDSQQRLTFVSGVTVLWFHVTCTFSLRVILSLIWRTPRLTDAIRITRLRLFDGNFW